VYPPPYLLMRCSYPIAPRPVIWISSVSALLVPKSRTFAHMEVSMSSVRKLLAVPLIVLIATAAPSFADQRHLVDSAQLAALVGAHAAQQDADRAAVREAIGRKEVRDVAAKLGVDLTRAAAAVDTMSGADLTRAADAARQVNQQLVGGASSVVISTTTI